MKMSWMAPLAPWFALLIHAQACAAPVTQRADSRSIPVLVVVFVIDMLPAGTLEEFRPLLSGGYGRFLQEARRFTACQHEHACTSTGPGHATLLSGLHPSHHGIIGNDWYDRDSRKAVYCAGDDGPDTRPSFDGSAPRSPDNLRGENLADLIKRSNPRSKVYTVAGKDRSAILSGGHVPDGAFWYSKVTGGYTSNPSIVSELPAWGRDFWGEALTRTSLFTENVPAEWTYPQRPEALADDHPSESALMSRVAPHPVAEGDAARLARRVYLSPWVDWLTLQLAGRIIKEERLGSDDAPDLIVVGLSSTDTVGHLYGPDSQEYLDVILRVDSWIGEFMKVVETAAAARDHGGVVFALSSDHGVLPLPESNRIDITGLMKRITTELPARLAPDATTPLLVAPERSQIYFDRRALAEHDVDLQRAVEELRRLLADSAAIDRVYLASELTDSGDGDFFLELYRNAYDPERGGDLVVQPCERCLLTSRPTGTSHGSPYDYDRKVPMILMGGPFEPGEDGSACATVDLAPTLASLLDIEFESPRDGRILPRGGS